MPPFYLDYNATTPIDPAVVEAMQPYLRQHFGNPSSTHAFGQEAHEAVDRARAQAAGLIDAQPGEIVFTGGGSEASNQAIKGVAFPLLFGSGNPAVCARDMASRRVYPAGLVGWFGRVLKRFAGARRAPHIITSAIEHPATLRPCEFLQRLGCEVTVLPVDRFGVVDVDAVKKALERPTALVTIMHSNNEVGTLQPIAEIARFARNRGALVHTDVAQSLGKVKVDVNELGVDFLSIAGHKVYAPKGIGALYVRDGLALEPLIHGAGHEAGRRAGTENVPYIVALGAACAIAKRALPEATEKLRRLRDRLWQRLREALPDRVSLNGHPERRLPNTLNVNFAGHIGAELLASVPDVAASTGSACHEGQVHLSPVLKAMGVAGAVGRGAVRLTVGRFTTEEEVDRAAELLAAAARKPQAVGV
jgi:cysteine desulfurase